MQFLRKWEKWKWGVKLGRFRSSRTPHDKFPAQNVLWPVRAVRSPNQSEHDYLYYIYRYNDIKKTLTLNFFISQQPLPPSPQYSSGTSFYHRSLSSSINFIDSSCFYSRVCDIMLHFFIFSFQIKSILINFYWSICLYYFLLFCYCSRFHS